MQGKVCPSYYCAKCGGLLVKKGRIKITSYDIVSGKPSFSATLVCPKRTMFSHRTKAHIAKDGDNNWSRVYDSGNY